MKKVILFSALILVFVSAATAQINIEANPDIQSVNIGGKNQMEHIIKTQLIIPEHILKLEDKEVTIYFTVTKNAEVFTPFFKEEYPDFYKSEAKRLLRYFIFEPAKKASANVDAYCSLTISFSAKKYKLYLKERNKYKLNLSANAPDTSFVIYEVADRSPDFYKGADELTQFIFESIEYPNVAKNQNIEGTVPLSFIVEANGYVSNVKPLKIIGGGCTDEAIRVINLTRWKPAEKSGKYVRYKMTYPITFTLKNISRDNSGPTQ